MTKYTLPSKLNDNNERFRLFLSFFIEAPVQYCRKRLT